MARLYKVSDGEWVQPGATMAQEQVDQPRQPELEISLAGVRVEFPDGWWDDPSNDLIGPRGRTMLDERIDGLALIIAGTLRQLLKDRRPASSGLVDPQGRALQSSTPPCAAGCGVELVYGEVMREADCDRGHRHYYHHVCAERLGVWSVSDPIRCPAH